MKISFIGDVMCEKPMLLAACQNGKYNFDGIFDDARELFSKSDIVVCNMETPFAGEAAGYTVDYHSFNTPDSFLDELIKAGVTVFTTANNHCLDRGIEGLKRTIDVFDERNVFHTGTFRNSSENSPLIIEVGGIKVAFLSCTYGTNFHRNKKFPESGQVNILRPYNESQYIHVKTSISNKICSILRRILGEDRFAWLQKNLGKSEKNIRKDDLLNLQTIDIGLSILIGKISEVRSRADLVFVCPHMGGQYNIEPGIFSLFVMDKIAAAGVDAVVANHAHVIQRGEIKNGIPCLYALGNFSSSLSNPHCVNEVKPEYSVMMHFYISENTIDKITFTILKIVEDASHRIKVKPICDKMIGETDVQKAQTQKDIQMIYERITGGPMGKTEISNEFQYFDCRNNRS